MAYCPRQFALIHVEQAWEENYFTAQGQALHERVDAGAPEQRGNVRYERSVAVYSQTLGISGKLDLLEVEAKQTSGIFRWSINAASPKPRIGTGYSFVRRPCVWKKCVACRLMRRPCWYWQERKRERVLIDATLRVLTMQAIEQAREILARGITPPPTRIKAAARRAR